MSERIDSRPTRNNKPKSSAVAEPQSPSVATDIHIDYPREEELIIPGHYAVRLSGAPDAQVELSINDGDWTGCRTAVGYYWFDWEPSKAGEYTLLARQKVGKGRAKKSEPRFCRVVGKKN